MINKRDVKILSNSLDLLNDLLRVVCNKKFRPEHMRDTEFPREKILDVEMEQMQRDFYKQVMSVLDHYELLQTDRGGHHRDELDDIKAFVKDDIEFGEGV